MAYRDLNTLSVRDQVQHKYARRAAQLVNVFQCLIVSADPQRRRMLERAASDSGWKTFACGDAPAALQHANRWLVQLAVVDLEAPDAQSRDAQSREIQSREIQSREIQSREIQSREIQSPEGFRPLVEQLTARSGMLAIVCGNEGNVDEEIWVRQRGAWMYLPGVADTSNVSLLCGEAKQIAERLGRTGDSEREPAEPVA